MNHCWIIKSCITFDCMWVDTLLCLSSALQMGLTASVAWLTNTPTHMEWHTYNTVLQCAYDRQAQIKMLLWSRSPLQTSRKNMIDGFFFFFYNSIIKGLWTFTIIILRLCANNKHCEGNLWIEWYTMWESEWVCNRVQHSHLNKMSKSILRKYIYIIYIRKYLDWEMYNYLATYGFDISLT